MKSHHIYICYVWWWNCTEWFTLTCTWAKKKFHLHLLPFILLCTIFLTNTNIPSLLCYHHVCPWFVSNPLFVVRQQHSAIYYWTYMNRLGDVVSLISRVNWPCDKVDVCHAGQSSAAFQEWPGLFSCAYTYHSVHCTNYNSHIGLNWCVSMLACGRKQLTIEFFILTVYFIVPSFWLCLCVPLSAVHVFCVWCASVHFCYKKAQQFMNL